MLIEDVAKAKCKVNTQECRVKLSRHQQTTGRRGRGMAT